MEKKIISENRLMIINKTPSNGTSIFEYISTNKKGEMFVDFYAVPSFWYVGTVQ